MCYLALVNGLVGVGVMSNANRFASLITYRLCEYQRETCDVQRGKRQESSTNRFASGRDDGQSEEGGGRTTEEAYPGEEAAAEEEEGGEDVNG